MREDFSILYFYNTPRFSATEAPTLNATIATASRRLLIVLLLLLPAACTMLDNSECRRCDGLKREYSRLKTELRVRPIRAPSPVRMMQYQKIIDREEFAIREIDAKLKRSGQGYSKYVDDEGNPVEIKATPDGFLERTVYYKDGRTSKARIPRLSPRELFEQKQQHREALDKARARLIRAEKRKELAAKQELRLLNLERRLQECRKQFCSVTGAGASEPADSSYWDPESIAPVRTSSEDYSELEDVELAPKASISFRPGAAPPPPAEKPAAASNPEQTVVETVRPSVVVAANQVEDGPWQNWIGSQGVYIGEGSCSAQFTRLTSKGQRDLQLNPLGDDAFKGQNNSVTFNVDPSDARYALHYETDLVMNATTGWRCMIIGQRSNVFLLECERGPVANKAAESCAQTFTRTDNF